MRTVKDKVKIRRIHDHGTLEKTEYLIQKEQLLHTIQNVFQLLTICLFITYYGYQTKEDLLCFLLTCDVRRSISWHRVIY